MTTLIQRLQYCNMKPGEIFILSLSACGLMTIGLFCLRIGGIL